MADITVEHIPRSVRARALAKQALRRARLALLNSASAFLATAVLASQLSPAYAAEGKHWAYLLSVSTYKPLAGFNHVLGPTRFVGYFLPGPDVCRVTVFVTAAADDKALVTRPQKIEIAIEAGDRRELPAGDGSAVAIACTSDADLIKIAPQRRLQDRELSRVN